MGTDNVEKRRAGSGRYKSGVHSVEGTDCLSTECPGDRSLGLPISVRTKSLTFRSNRLRLQHKEHLLHLKR